MSSLSVTPLRSIGEVNAGSDLAELIIVAARSEGVDLADRDVLVVTQKVVSKAEDAIEAVDPLDPLSHKPLVEREAVRVLRRRGDLLLTETRHGFVCANAGIDLSNVESGTAALLPEDPDRSARRIRDAVLGRTGVAVGVVVSDTFGRPWRRGVTDVAIGAAGVRPVVDLRGTRDAYGRELQVTEVAVVDEIAAAADLVMGKASGTPVAVLRGLPHEWFTDDGERNGVLTDLVRPHSDDLFR